ncbi:MAG: Lrp/AsnC ligand binding domain-containing protein [Nitrososphaerota archaeon]|nr:Lrp/AsnC ligand binding domain-containing protein [Candidatus Calditenuaceae archaeon]MDW8074000.1 Lrp/AsnC ligand binding domain-containing protein [Nitrososphaerota archaeon]
MVQAFVFIRTRAGKASSVAEQAGKLSGCKLACMVTGRYDVVVLLEAADLKALTDTVLSKIHTIDGVESTETAIVV